MLDSVLKNTPLDKEMVQWLKNRPSVYQSVWDQTNSPLLRSPSSACYWVGEEVLETTQADCWVFQMGGTFLCIDLVVFFFGYTFVIPLWG